MLHRPRRAVAVLASGTGSNALAIADACEDGTIEARLACIVTDRSTAAVVERARARGITVEIVERGDPSDAAAHDVRIVEALHRYGVDHVVLAGYMRMCGPAFLAAFEGCAINVHPSLLPAFPGRDAIGDAIAAGVDVTGVTVHFLDEGMDTGPVIAQAALAIESNDDRRALATRIHALEHRLLPAVTAGLVTGDIALRPGRDVFIAPSFRARLDALTHHQPQETHLP